MARSTHLFIATIVLFALTSIASAQRNPTMPTAMSDSDKEQLYTRFAENKKVPSADRQRLAYEDAKDYVRRFGNDVDPHLAEVRRFVTEYERVMKNYQLLEAYRAKKYAKAFEIGRATLKKEPENFFVLATLVEAGYDNAQTGDTSLNEETIGHANVRARAPGGRQGVNIYSIRDCAKTRVAFLTLRMAGLCARSRRCEAADALTKAVKVRQQVQRRSVDLQPARHRHSERRVRASRRGIQHEVRQQATLSRATGDVAASRETRRTRHRRLRARSRPQHHVPSKPKRKPKCWPS